MSYEQIKKAMAPCGLSCEKCFAHVDGDIRAYSRKLKEKLGNFAPYAERFESFLGEPIFKKYPDFEEVLDYLASENCKGCREDQCKLFKECGVSRCHREKRVDFCFQCEEFPCEKTHFDENLAKAWMRINEKIRKIGLERFYEKMKDRPRYV